MPGRSLCPGLSRVPGMTLLQRPCCRPAKLAPMRTSRAMTIKERSFSVRHLIPPPYPDTYEAKPGHDTMGTTVPPARLFQRPRGVFGLRESLLISAFGG